MRWWRQPERDVDEVVRRTSEAVGKVDEACDQLEEAIAGVEMILRVRDDRDDDDEG